MDEIEYCIAENFHEFHGLEPPMKVSSTKFGCAISTYDRFYVFRESFLHQMVISYHSVKVFSLKFSCHMVSRAYKPLTVSSLQLDEIHTPLHTCTHSN